MRVRTLVCAMLPLLACGCTSSDQEGEKRWTYRGKATPISYDVDEKNEGAFSGEDAGTFIGTCSKLKSPRFALMDGRYPAVAQLELQVDDSSWPVEVLQGDHFRQVQIRDARANDAIGRARRQIAFVADGGWKLVIKPGPLLANFYSDCQTQAWSLISGSPTTSSR